MGRSVQEWFRITLESSQYGLAVLPAAFGRDGRTQGGDREIAEPLGEDGYSGHKNRGRTSGRRGILSAGHVMIRMYGH